MSFDCADPRRLAEFWCIALGYEAVDVDDDEAFIGPAGGGNGLYFQRVPERKVVKNRVHLDLRPPRSMAAEVERLRDAGATDHRFVEKGGSFWTVMLDPQGNEFCVLRGPEDGWSPDHLA
ncbi:MAG TPA: VOC family protein [Actinomycetota bacterium]|nr:VOC family protein [Actinomycetota bacterium]